MTITVKNVALILHALGFASLKHRNQRRKGKDSAPYINHLIEVAGLLWRIGRVRDPDIIAAGILHDTVEDTNTTTQELAAGFGPKVGSIVLEVTDDKSLPDTARKHRQVEHAESLSYGARLVKLADKISNIREVIETPPAGWSLERRRSYVKWGEDVVNKIRGTNRHLERMFDNLCKTAWETFGKEEKNL